MSLGTSTGVTVSSDDKSIIQSSELSFAGKGLKLDSDQDAQEIIEAIKVTKDLHSLELKGNTLGVNAARAIGSALERHSGFKRALWSDLFTGRLKTEIPDALKFLCGGLMTAKACLVELDLSDNAFGPNGMIGLTDFLKSSSCYTLRELKLNNNGLGITGGKMLAESLLACHTASVAAGTPLALEVFVSGRGRLEDEGATALAQAFKAMKSLVEVHMPQNGINARGITALAEAFALNTKLKHINLSDNTFTEKGSTSMAKALPSLTALEVINFDDCLIRTAGAHAIAKSLAYNNHQLKILKLSGNEITKEGAEAVVGSVTNKSQLEELDLNANQLGESGKENVKRLLKAANKLKLLQSLSDDEGSEEEEEGEGESDDNEEENKSEEEDAGDNDSGEEYVQDGGLEVIGQALKSLSIPTVSAELQEFLSFPSAQKLQRLGPNKADDMLNFLGDKVKESDVVIPLLMKISGVVSDGDQQTRVIACELADILLSRTFSEGTVSVICNAILVHLGLIKSEDKTFHPSDNIDGALIVLQHVVRQKYFPHNAKETLVYFIEQSLTNLKQPSPFRHQLLDALREH